MDFLFKMALLYKVDSAPLSIFGQRACSFR